MQRCCDKIWRGSSAESELSESTEPELIIESGQKFSDKEDQKKESTQAEPEDWEWWDEG